MTERVKCILLAGLVMGWLALVAGHMTGETEPQRMPLINKTGQAGPSRSATKLTSLRSQKPRAVPVSFTNPKDIFAPLEQRLESVTAKPHQASSVRARIAVKKPAPPSAPVDPVPVPASSPVVTVSEPSAEELAARQAREQLGQYRFIGYLSEGTQYRAFLKRASRLYVVGTGEGVEGPIQVKAIDAAFVKLQDERTRVEATLYLTRE